MSHGEGKMTVTLFVKTYFVHGHFAHVNMRSHHSHQKKLCMVDVILVSYCCCNKLYT